ncbi:MAG TPA: ammonia-forming cytochrome c nitrite reductase subunit c552 [Phycisphaerales bacterium]|nr:ammonia-forming cytochrome c nitrite reductase subunit c552 [Phycisphaerales bacterium]
MSKAGYIFVGLLAAGATFAVAMLAMNISDRKKEAKETVFRVTELTEKTVDPKEWGKNFPRQYDGYLRTVDVERTKFGGSEAFQHLDDDPVWRHIFAGYAFSIDYREERGHAYMLSDQRETERVKQKKQPGSCLQCHASNVVAYREAGLKAGAPGTLEESATGANGMAQIQKGFEEVCKMSYTDATTLVEHPVACIDCHDPDTMLLRVTKPGFINGIAALAKSGEPVPHLPSIERWRKGARTKDYDPNVDASRQEMRSMACGQCHVEYYFKGEGKVVTYPWHKGLKVEQIESYYDEVGWTDWKHAESGAPALKAQHPEFEMWSQGIHARSGVSCADCHMPYKREGAIKVSDHHIRSPLLNAAKACQVCHPYSEDEIKGRVEAIQDRTKKLMDRAEDAVLAAIQTIQSAAGKGATDEQLRDARALQRKAQWRLDFVSAENSMGFHAPQESARILGEAIDYGRQAEMKAREQGGVPGGPVADDGKPRADAR